ncbi:hypothetical protein OBBRIDRAFT_805890 [Obba rivulosa]|uniref:CxC2-like cysteine cluster KDZ transposase-associated domain-containing protein n=1 Tax=Obba rivulosa TaxID=1052685 RepID=A0A8E2AYA1_9APHY|nr:hypothetical protein OBBRIDRAFT_805890 [Obba rivulosa]
MLALKTSKVVGNPGESARVLEVPSEPQGAEHTYGFSSTQEKSKGTLPRSVCLGRFIAEWAKRALDTWLAYEQRPPAVACKECGAALVCDKGLGDNELDDIGEATYRSRSTALKFGKLHEGSGSRSPLAVWECVEVSAEPCRMTIVHSNGIDEVEVRFYGCLDDELEGTPHAQQLIAHGMWPGSWKKPVTVFTIEMTAQDFYRYLRHLTDNIMPDNVPDRYCELLFAMKWPVDKRNFQQNQRQKPANPDDFTLIEGTAYFADIGDFANFQRNLEPLQNEASTCHKFGTMEYGGYGGQVSGTVDLSCAHHIFVLPGSGVDLQKGKRFTNVDFTMILGLQWWMQILLVISGYNINCQYRRNFEKHMKWFKNNFGRLRSIQHMQFPTTLTVIGKFHLPAHNSVCRFKFLYYWMPEAAMTDKEAPERIWAVLNGLAVHTQEMAVGHRHDIINDHHSDMNVWRVHDMARSLKAKHKEALIHAEAMDDELTRLESKLPDEKLKEWKHAKGYLSTYDDLNNPYELKKEKDSVKVLFVKQIVARLNQELSESPHQLERLKICKELHDTTDMEGLSHKLCNILQSKAERGAICAEELEALSALQIELPSSYNRNVLFCKDLKEARTIEMQLCEGYVNNALAEIRVHLIMKFSLKQQQTELTGQKMMTRSRQHIKQEEEAIDCTAKLYRQEDCAWLEDTEDRALKNFIADAMRVHWFQRSALKAS